MRDSRPINMITLNKRGVRILGGDAGRAVDLYITLRPETERGDIETQALEIYKELREILEETKASIFSERIFATKEAMAVVEAVRRDVLGAMDDGVAPTRIVVARGVAGALAGIQVHAVMADKLPIPLPSAQEKKDAIGREFQINGTRWLMFNGVGAALHKDMPPSEQARLMFDQFGRLLRQAGTDMRAVARTWLWLRDICLWYKELNEVRTSFFRHEGLVEAEGQKNVSSDTTTVCSRLPASTGIGVANQAGLACIMDAIAVLGKEGKIEFWESAGAQQSAFNYGSAFSRAAVASMPGGRTILVSGTAAIDPSGQSEHIGQIRAQIEATVRYVRALLAQAGCGDEEVLSSLVFCKDLEVEKMWQSAWGEVRWPAVSMIAEVCRPELLFEVEVIAGPVICKKSSDA